MTAGMDKARGGSTAHAERRWLLRAAAAAALITCLPYLVGFASQGSEWVFSGSVLAVEEGNNYLAVMRRGFTGDWLFKAPYSAFPQNGLFVYFPFLLLGKLTTTTGQFGQMLVLFHGFRLLSVAALFIASYCLMAIFIEDIVLRRWGAVLLVFGGGLGWLLIALGQESWLGSSPLDFYSPETFGFLAALSLPHLAAARALMYTSLALLLRRVDNPRREGLLIGMVWLGMFLFQAITLGVTGLVAGAYVLANGLRLAAAARQGKPADWARWWGEVKRLLWAGGIVVLPMAYLALSISRDPYGQAWSAQNLITSPHPAHYLAAYGLLLPAAWIGLRHLLQEYPWRGWLLGSWAALLPVLLYVPVNIQRRFADGFWLAMIIMALKGLERTRLGKRPSVRLGIFIPALLTSLMLLTATTAGSSRPAEPQFFPAEEAEFYLQAGELVMDGDVILAAHDTSNLAPVWLPVFVLIGHGPESIGLAEISPRVANFFQTSASDAGRLALLDEFGVDYVLWGPREKALGGWNPGESSFLDLAVEVRNYHLYRVNK